MTVPLVTRKVSSCISCQCAGGPGVLGGRISSQLEMRLSKISLLEMSYKYEEGYSLVPVREPSSITRSFTEPRAMTSPSFACTKVTGTFGVLTTGGIFKRQVLSSSEIGGSIEFNSARIGMGGFLYQKCLTS